MLTLICYGDVYVVAMTTLLDCYFVTMVTVAIAIGIFNTYWLFCRYLITIMLLRLRRVAITEKAVMIHVTITIL